MNTEPAHCEHVFPVLIGSSSLWVRVCREHGAITRVVLSINAPGGIATRDYLLPMQRFFQNLMDGKAGPESASYLASGTEFQKKIWTATLRVPYGYTATYGEIAAAAGQGSPRAVGQALRANPVPLLIPCHRIVGANGRLTGFSAGLEIKKLLLRHEHEICSGK